MLEKIKVEQAEEMSRIARISKYCINPFYLAFNGYVESNNGELLFYERDEIYRNDFPYIIFPRTKDNAMRAISTHCTEDDLIRIKKWGITMKRAEQHGTEFYYRTADFTNPGKPSFASFRKSISTFSRKYEYKILDKYPVKKIMGFLKKWEYGQEEKNILFEFGSDYTRFCIDNMKKINGKWHFIEINGELAGFSLSCRLNDEYWVGVHQKVDYDFKGIGRFLLHQRAKSFQTTPFFTLGTEAKDEGLHQFKESLHPCREEARYFVLTE